MRPSIRFHSSAARAISVVLTTMAFPVPVDSFLDHSLYSLAGSRENIADRKSALRTLGFPTTLPISTTNEEETDQRDPSFDRRSLLLAGVSVTAGYFLKENSAFSRVPATLTTLEPSVEAGIVAPTTSTVSSVEEALTIIESMGDKRFLHAIVASDYKFVYEQRSKTLPPDIDADKIFSKKAPSSASNGSRSVVLGATGSLASKKAPSLWPLENALCSTVASCSGIHYAWPELGGVLQSNTNTDSDAQTMIVDGIDCGKMALEDALEGDMQVLVQAPTYLSVPSYMESNLRRGLQGAFLI
mmetsp:Transcript_2631/g.5700  ORF Transcript_2631/g.5700 Transcript_2631/m.5700 type:complete len:300 (-) Transcript_2631:1640-2539(-)